MEEITDCWMKTCFVRVSALRDWANGVESIQKGTNIATITGSSVGIVGAGLGITALSLALAPFTFGSSVILGLTVAGGVVGGAGAVTGISAAATRFGYKKSKKKALVEILEKYKSESSQMTVILMTLDNIFKEDLTFYNTNIENTKMLEPDSNKLIQLKTYVTQLCILQHDIKFIKANNTIISPIKDGGEEINTEELKSIEKQLNQYSVLCDDIRTCFQGPKNSDHTSLTDDIMTKQSSEDISSSRNGTIKGNSDSGIMHENMELSHKLYEDRTEVGDHSGGNSKEGFFTKAIKTMKKGPGKHTRSTESRSVLRGFMESIKHNKNQRENNTSNSQDHSNEKRTSSMSESNTVWWTSNNGDESSENITVNAETEQTAGQPRSKIAGYAQKAMSAVKGMRGAANVGVNVGEKVLKGGANAGRITVQGTSGVVDDIGIGVGTAVGAGAGAQVNTLSLLFC